MEMLRTSPWPLLGTPPTDGGPSGGPGGEPSDGPPGVFSSANQVTLVAEFVGRSGAPRLVATGPDSATPGYSLIVLKITHIRFRTVATFSTQTPTKAIFIARPDRLLPNWKRS